jgi:hypothetical protein
MIYWLINLPPIIGGLLTAAIAILIGLLTYGGAHFFVGQYANKESSELAVNLFRIIAGLLALLLSLTFADVRVEIGAVRNSIEVEAALLVDVYKDLSVFDSEQAREIEVKLARYVDAIIEDEWEALRKEKISERVIVIFRDLENSILFLETKTPFQQEIRVRLMEDIDAASSSRATRIIQAGRHTPVFLYVAVIGFLWTTVLLSVYKPRDKAIFFVSAYCAFFGVVTYFILALGNYFEGFGGVTPDSFILVSDYMKRL